MDSLAWVYYRRGDFKDALTWQLKAHKESKEPDPEVLLHLGMIYAALKDKARARKYILQASKIENIEADIMAKIKAKLKELE
jgi:TolA-binding protein